MPKPSRQVKDKKKVVTLRLSTRDLAILDRFRGELSREAFITVLLRMIDSGAVSRPPETLTKPCE